MKHVFHTLALIVVLILVASCSTKAPQMGVQDGQFAACTEEDCVSSQALDAHRIDPIKATGDPAVVMVDLGNTIESIFGGKVLNAEGNYLRAEFKSRVLRTVDDAEFLYDPEAGVIHVHAATRGETLDVDSSRERIEELRAEFAKRR